jgi:hypothetical protein
MANPLRSFRTIPLSFSSILLSFSSILSLAVLVVLAPSCSTEIHASNDWAKEKEAMNSAAEQFEIVNYNLGVFVDPILAINADDDSKEPAEDAAEAKKTRPRFGLQVGLEFVGKGGKYQDGSTIGLNYLEVPIYGTYSYPINEQSGVFGGLGPFLAYGIGGKVKSGGFESPSFGESNGGYKRFDGGLSFIAGYRYRDFKFYFDYDLGLANTAYPILDITSKSRSYGFNIAYSLRGLFGPKSK